MRFKSVRFLFLLVIVLSILISGNETPAWPSLGPWINGYPAFTVHAKVAWDVVNEPTVAAWLAGKGLDRVQIALWASREPAGWDHWGYGAIASGAFLAEMAPTEEMIGKLLHCTGDCGVAVNHSPANEWYTDSNLVEGHYELAGEEVVFQFTWTPAEQSFADESALFHAAMEQTTNWFKNIPESRKRYWDPWTQWLAKRSLSDCTRWSHAAMLYYIDSSE